MKKRKVVSMTTPEGLFTRLMAAYTTLKKQRLILLRGDLKAVNGTCLDDPPPLGEATIRLYGIPARECFVVIKDQTPPDLKRKIRRSARRLQGLLLQVNTYWLEEAINQLYALGADGNLNLDPLTEFATLELEAQAEDFLAKIPKISKPRRGA